MPLPLYILVRTFTILHSNVSFSIQCQLLTFFQFDIIVKDRIEGDRVPQFTAETSGSIMQGSIRYNDSRTRIDIEDLGKRLSLAQKEGNLQIEQKSCYFLGRKHELLGEFSESLEFYLSCLQIARSTGDKTFQLKALIRLCFSYAEFKLSYHGTVEFLGDAFKLCSELSDSSADILWYCKALLAKTDVLLVQSSIVSELRIRPLGTSPSTCLGVFLEVFIAYLGCGSVTAETLDRFTQFVTEFHCKSCDSFLHCNYLWGAGRLFLNAGLIDRALHCFDLALSIATTSGGSSYLHTRSLYEMGVLYCAESNFRLAHTTCLLARDISAELLLKKSRLKSSLSSLVRFLENQSEAVGFADTELQFYLDNYCSSTVYSNLLHAKVSTQSQRVLLLKACCSLDSALLEKIIPMLQPYTEICKSDSVEHVAYLIYKFPSIAYVFEPFARDFLQGLAPPSTEVDKLWYESSLGLLSLASGNITLYRDHLDSVLSLMKVRHLAWDDSLAEFSYFSSREASKSIHKLVNGFKMDSRSHGKLRGLTAAFESKPSKRSKSGDVVSRDVKGSTDMVHSGSICVTVLFGREEQIEIRLPWDAAETTTIGSLLVSVGDRYQRRYLKVISVDHLETSKGSKASPTSMITKYVTSKGDSCSFTARFAVHSYDFAVLLEKLAFDQELAESLKSRLNNCSLDKVDMSYIDSEAISPLCLMMLDHVDPNLTHTILFDSCRQASEFLDRDFDIKNLGLRGSGIRVIDLAKISACSTVDISFNPFEKVLLSCGPPMSWQELFARDIQIDPMHVLSEGLRCPLLTHLDLSFNTTDASLEELLERLSVCAPNLLVLSIVGLKTSMRNPPGKIPADLKKLETIEIGFMGDEKQVSHVVSTIFKAAASLRTVNTTHCPSGTKELLSEHGVEASKENQNNL